MLCRCTDCPGVVEPSVHGLDRSARVRGTRELGWVMSNRQDNIGLAFAGASCILAWGANLAPEGYPRIALFACWAITTATFAYLLWRRVTPKNGWLSRWRMHRLGYRWGPFVGQYSHKDGLRFISCEDDSWFWHAWTEVGTDAYEASGGPALDPVGAHILGCLQNWGES